MTEIDMPAAMDKAAETLVIGGRFGKGRFFRKGCYCALGAYALGLGVKFDESGLMDLSGGDVDYTDAFDRGWEHLNETVKPLGFDAVQTMNDATETTAEQMATVLRETAARLRAAAA